MYKVNKFYIKLYQSKSWFDKQIAHFFVVTKLHVKQSRKNISHYSYWSSSKQRKHWSQVFDHDCSQHNEQEESDRDRVILGCAQCRGQHAVLVRVLAHRRVPEFTVQRQGLFFANEEHDWRVQRCDHEVEYGSHVF